MNFYNYFVTKSRNLTFQKKLRDLLLWKPFKNDEEYFLKGF